MAQKNTYKFASGKLNLCSEMKELRILNGAKMKWDLSVRIATSKVKFELRCFCVRNGFLLMSKSISQVLDIMTKDGKLVNK